MDVNGTRFHLIHGQAAWGRCHEEPDPDGKVHVEWDSQAEMLSLHPQLALFPRGKRDAPLQPSARRGAAVDRFGNWYWIANDRRRIYWLPTGSGRPQVYWAPTATCACQSTGEFRPLSADAPMVAELGGLAVTEHHFLIVGSVTQKGLLLFDLHAGGEPLLLLFPAGVPFEPFDMAAAPGGGVWVLDRVQRTYWGLDRQFRVVTEPAFMEEMEPAETFTFHPVGGTAVVRPAREFLTGFPVAARNPISIEDMPDGSVLILDSPEEAVPVVASTLYQYRLDQLLSSMTLPDLTGVVSGEDKRPLVGHDIAYTPADHTLYVLERDGNQSVAFNLDEGSPPGQLSLQQRYLPMHFFGSRALVAVQDNVFYEVVGGEPGNDDLVRWVQLQVIDQPRYERMATLLTPVFDGKERDCVWHRMFLDACIPPETSVEVWTRAGNGDESATVNDAPLLDGIPFSLEPKLYLRGSGPELPYYRSFPENSLSDATGTWELLFQQARGRYLQIKLVLTGNGRMTPELQTLRAYYPRFSYPKRYLPAVYQDDGDSAAFLERLLANPEGFYTDIEGKIAAVGALFDARRAPLEALDWLASWVGLVLDPMWATLQQQRLTASGSTKPAPDRRRLFIRFALTLYDRRGTVEGIKFALQLLLHPCLETTLQRFKTAAVNPDSVLRQELPQLGLSYPTPVMSEEEYGTLLYDYILSPKRPSKVRIVERFQARDGRAVVAGDPTRTGSGATAEDTIQASAHRFSVLVPQGLSSAEAAMVGRIVGLEKPAHTIFDVRRYWDYFRVGDARLGLDTVLGEGGRFVPMVLGRDYLADGYLSAAYPMDVRERVISDRDRVGGMPL